MSLLPLFQQELRNTNHPLVGVVVTEAHPFLHNTLDFIVPTAAL
jgi:hypothetical protein